MKCFVELNTGLVNSHKGTSEVKEFLVEMLLSKITHEREIRKWNQVGREN